MNNLDTSSGWSVLLINPPVLIPPKAGGIDIFQPLGLAYVASALRDSGYKVRILDALAEGWKNVQRFDARRDFNGLDYDRIAEQVEMYSPKVVGISVPFSSQSDSAFRVASVVKSVDRRILTILGGPHPTVQPVECVSRPDVDFAVIGEGEHSLPELLEKLMRGASVGELKETAGIAFKDDNGGYIAPPRPFIRDLDSLRFPARDLLPMHVYFEAAKRQRGNRDLNKRWASMITSRGCPYCCVFCSINLTMGRKWRARSPQNVADELKQLIDTYGIEQISFEDDNMTLDSNRMEQICDLVMEANLRFEWFTPNGVRCDTLDELIIRKMKKSGCKEVWFAPESGSQRVVNEIIGKRLDLKKVEENVVICKEVGISSNCFFVIGFPGETKREIEETIEFAKNLGRLGVDNCLFSIATPLYGTALYKEAKEKGLIREMSNDMLMYDQPIIETSEFTARELLDFQRCAQWENRRLFIKNSFSKLMYYAKNNPTLAFEHLANLSRISRIFLRRRLTQLLRTVIGERV